ncbi:MAG: bidirectional hydrogenase complex protein HoxU [Anaerolineae bacterium]|nr:bidirectional hydrogenase complex protein HoxU [Anaerolineae bacterium]
MSEIQLTINGQAIKAAEGETILETARANGIDIPTLCHQEGVTPTGACRMCLVELDGTNKLLPSCVTRAADGMVIRTDTEKLKRYRRTILELLFAERNHTCAVCVSNGHCELQSQAQAHKIDHVNFDYRNPQLIVDLSHERFGIDHNRCILCGRCVRVCDEIEGAHTRDMRNRGIATLIITDFDQSWGEASSCTNCGKCVEVCPTGALFIKGLGAGEMVKNHELVPGLVNTREVVHAKN